MGHGHQFASSWTARVFQPIAVFSNNYTIPASFSLLLLAYCLCVCFAFPRIGTADNGDYAVLMPTIGVKHTSENPSDIYFNYFRQHYSKETKANLPDRIGILFAKFPSSIFTLASYGIDSIFGNSKTYSIHYLGIIYSFAYSLAIFLLLSVLCRDLGGPSQFLLCLITCIIYSDSIFVTYFNFFYQEPAFLVLFLLSIAALAKGASRLFIPELLVFCTSLTKVPNAVFSLLYLSPLFTNGRRAKLIAPLFVLTIVAAAVNINRNNAPNLFNSFFCGVLMHNSDKQKVLADFGLTRPEYATYIEKSYWSVFGDNNSANKDIRKDFYSKVSMTKIILYYAQNPAMLLSKFTYGLDCIRSQPPRTNALGNYTREYGKKQYGGIALFSDHMGFFTIIVPAFAVVVLILQLFGKKFRNFLFSLSLLLLLPLIVLTSIVSSGFTDFAKQMFPFYSVLAATCALSLGSMLRHLAPRSGQ